MIVLLSRSQTPATKMNRFVFVNYEIFEQETDYGDIKRPLCYIHPFQSTAPTNAGSESAYLHKPVQ